MFSSGRSEKVLDLPSQVLSRSKPKQAQAKEIRECFYCHKQGHIVVDCPVLKRKQQSPKSVGFVRVNNEQSEGIPDTSYKPFLMKGFVSLTGLPDDQVEITMLRDTGSVQSFLLAGVIPLTEETFCGSNVIVQGIEMGFVKVPLHRVHLQSDLVSDFVKVGVRSSLPMQGISFILGNDLAGGKVMSSLEVLEKPILCSSPDDLSQVYPNVFTACAITHSQSRKADDVDLSELFSVPVLKDEICPVQLKVDKQLESQNVLKDTSDISGIPLTLSVSREQICGAQREDKTLNKCFSSVILTEVTNASVVYFLDNGLLMRRWRSTVDMESNWNDVFQIVVPVPYIQQVLSLAHDHVLSGHLGITKTYNRILRHFFWPGLRKDMSQYCRTCDTCQFTGKPNQKIPPAPLCPIPAVGEPFEHVIINCVGPLPMSKTGNQFLLTMMCVATRFPEAIPMRNVTAPTVVKALTKFFTTFGFPRVVQTDQGKNFMSRLFKQVMQTLSISHRVSSAYHPESQGALERFHQTLKSMLRKYCLESGKEWDEGVPLVLFAVREATQESLKFSPAELVFGHSVRGPLNILKKQMMQITTTPRSSVLDYVSKFRERLHEALSFAHKSLTVAQGSMKRRHDKTAVIRTFQSGDQVLVLLPVPGSTLSARFAGPYVVVRKLNNTDYVIRTPDRKRQTRVCHVNMLKRYYERDDSSVTPTDETPGPVVSPVMVVNELSPSDCKTPEDEDGIVLRNTLQQCVDCLTLKC